MVFTSAAFAFAFLPVVLVLHLVLVGLRARNLFLLIASLVFYAFGSGRIMLLLVATTLLDWMIGRAIARARSADRAGRVRLLVASSVVANLGVLGWFKYAGFLVDDVVGPVASWLGAMPPAAIEVALPVGISFFTFQRMSYVIDVARGRVEPLDRATDLLLYVALFPQLIAGPIVRFHELRDQLLERRVSTQHLAAGAVRFAHGFAKKVLIADTIAVLADTGFGLDTGELTFAGAWLAVLAYTVQIYFDFSGYSDMAIGLGSMLGFALPENFRRPYSALSVTDFWRRWHITLSAWFRDYLYIPLGGSRRSRRRTLSNLVLVFLLTGLWHGAAWTFVAWGAWHGAFLVLERATGQRPTGEHRPRFPRLARATTFLVVVLGWVLFRSDSLASALAMWDRMFLLEPLGLPTAMVEVIDPAVVGALLVGLGSVLLPGSLVLGRRLVRGLEPQRVPVGDSARAPRLTFGTAAWQAATVTVVFAFSLVQVLGRTFQPFLYFRF